MKTMYIKVLLVSFFMSHGASAMIGQSISIQDKIMNQEAKLIEFNDVVRKIESMDDGSYKVFFEKHAAVYKMDAIKGKSLVDLLQKSQTQKTPLNISILPDQNQVILVVE